MKRTIRLFMLFEVATFVIAALVHAGVLVTGYEHQEACIAESVIAVVLFAGLALSWIRPAWTRTAGLTAQGFAFIGTLVGIFTIAIGIGPHTMPDLVYHAVIIIVLGWGLVVAKRFRSGNNVQQL